MNVKQNVSILKHLIQENLLISYCNIAMLSLQVVAQVIISFITLPSFQVTDKSSFLRNFAVLYD